MFRTVLAILVILAFGVPVEAEAPAKLKVGKPVVCRGELASELDISGGVVVGDFLLVISNEAHGVQVLKDSGEREYKVVGFIALAPKGTDLDIEALTADGTTIYATGSHSKLRKIGRKDGPDGGIGPVVAIPTRDQVFRFPLRPDGTAGKIESVGLRKILDADPVLKAFGSMASKENGVDIEGVAFKDGKLHFGFRGPVLRDNWCPVLVGEFDSLKKAELRYVQLGGRGIRDIAAIRDGFLILAGPMGDAELSFQIYHWDGTSGLPHREANTHARLIDVLPSGPKHRPEGLVVTKETDKTTELIVLHDGVAGGDPTKCVLEWKK